MSKRKVTYKLYPSKSQEEKLEHILGVHQRLYNSALEQRINTYAESKQSISFYDQCKELTIWRKNKPELVELNAQSEQVTLKRLDLAFQHFFRRIKNGETPGFPKFQAYRFFSGWGYKAHGDGWKLLCRENLQHGHVQLSNIGKIKIRGKSKNLGSPKTAEILHKNGKWFLSVTIECQPIRTTDGADAIAIDWGLKNFATMVDDKENESEIINPRLGKIFSKKIAKIQTKIHKATKGSNNRKKLVNKLVKIYTKLVNKRKEFAHQISKTLVEKYSFIATEALNIKKMTEKGGKRKRGLNREILNTTPRMFFDSLKYKAGEANVKWVEIPTKKVKPTQTCHKCGLKKKKTLWERTHKCVCGIECCRDINSAKVILNWALFENVTGKQR